MEEAAGEGGKSSGEEVRVSWELLLLLLLLSVVVVVMVVVRVEKEKGGLTRKTVPVVSGLPEEVMDAPRRCEDEFVSVGGVKRVTMDGAEAEAEAEGRVWTMLDADRVREPWEDAVVVEKVEDGIDENDLLVCGRVDLVRGRGWAGQWWGSGWGSGKLAMQTFRRISGDLVERREERRGRKLCDMTEGA
jgi:hypothetical protein